MENVLEIPAMAFYKSGQTSDINITQRENRCWELLEQKIIISNLVAVFLAVLIEKTNLVFLFLDFENVFSYLFFFANLKNKKQNNNNDNNNKKNRIYIATLTRQSGVFRER